MGITKRIKSSGCVFLSIAFLFLHVCARADIVIPRTADVNVIRVLSLDRVLWVATGEGAYRLQGTGMTRTPDVELDVVNLLQCGEDVWLQTDRGAYRFGGLVPERFPIDDEVPVFAMAKHDRTLWFGTLRGCFAWSNGQLVQLLKKEFAITSIVEAEHGVFVGSNSGLYFADAQTATNVDNFSSSVSFLSFFEGDVWIAGLDAVYKLEKGKILPIRAGNHPIVFREVESSLWVGTSKGCFKVTAGQVEDIAGIDTPIQAIEVFNGAVWLGAQDGLYKVVGKQCMKVPNSPARIREMKATERSLWIAALGGAYKFGMNKIVRVPQKQIFVNSICVVDGKVWFATQHGAFEVRENSDISIDLTYERGTLDGILNYFLPHRLWVAGNVKTKSKNPIGVEVQSDKEESFESIIETDFETFRRKVAAQEYAPSDLGHTLAPGQHLLHVAVRDKWGNTNMRDFNVGVIPGAAALAILGTLLSALFLMTIFSFAPFDRTSHRLLMSPMFRSIPSIGLVPAILTLSRRARAHVLRRYIGAIAVAPMLARAKKTFVAPNTLFQPEKWIREPGRVVYISGPSGIGKSTFLRSLALIQAERLRDHPYRRLLVPIFIELRFFSDLDPSKAIKSRLEDEGDLTDAALLDEFLRAGGFMIILDGYNEISVEQQGAVRNYLQSKQNTNNLYIISSRDPSPTDFEWAECIEYPYLSHDSLKKIVEQEFGTDDATESNVTNILTEMENAPSRLYKMPQYVKVALKIYKRSSTVPRNVIELYGRIFGDALQDAQQRMLEERAFESVSQRKQFYLESSVPNDSELIKQLNQTGFLMADKSTYQFSHHSIVIYLSAKHFAREWKQLLSKPDLIVDRNWADVLEMTCDLFTQHSDILDMLSLLSEKHRDIALQLLSRFTAAHPGLGEKALLPFWEHFSKSFFRLSRA